MIAWHTNEDTRSSPPCLWPGTSADAVCRRVQSQRGLKLSDRLELSWETPVDKTCESEVGESFRTCPLFSYCNLLLEADKSMILLRARDYFMKSM